MTAVSIPETEESQTALRNAQALIEAQQITGEFPSAQIAELNPDGSVKKVYSDLLSDARELWNVLRNPQWLADRRCL